MLHVYIYIYMQYIYIYIHSYIIYANRRICTCERVCVCVCAPQKNCQNIWGAVQTKVSLQQFHCVMLWIFLVHRPLLPCAKLKLACNVQAVSDSNIWCLAPPRNHCSSQLLSPRSLNSSWSSPSRRHPTVLSKTHHCRIEEEHLIKSGGNLDTVFSTWN